MAIKSLGYTVTIHGSNSYHAFKCDKCNKVIYNLSKKATGCSCEGETDGLYRSQIKGTGTETSSNAEGSIGSSGRTATSNDSSDESSGNGNGSD